jgi:hypothetical protein
MSNSAMSQEMFWKSATGEGTLVVMVPTSAGLVIAADSRITIGGNLGLYCDNSFKITEIDHVNRAAFIVTGYTTVWNFQNVPIGDICKHIQEVRAKFDINVILKEAIEQKPTFISTAIDDLPKVCIDAINQYSVASSGDFDSRRGAQIFQVAVASYDDVHGTSMVQSFSINMGNDGVVSASDFKVQEFNPGNEWQLLLFGEASYLTNNVFNGIGMQFLGDRYGRFRNGKTIIRETDQALAADFASDLIEAAAKTTSLVAAPTGIGGPVDVLLLGNSARPQRLRRKT